jgi:hypothetical protein
MRYNQSITFEAKSGHITGVGLTEIKTVISIYLHIYDSRIPFVGHWPLFQLLNPIHSQLGSLDGGSADRKAATYTQNNINTE